MARGYNGVIVNGGENHDPVRQIGRPSLRNVLRAGVLRPPRPPRAADQGPVEPLKLALQAYQSAMLRRDYADFARQPKYQPLTEFFFTQLYAPSDFGLRNESFRALHDWLAGIIGRDPVRVLSQAIELTDLTESLDEAMVQALQEMGVEDVVSSEAWDAAYRRVGRKPDRQRQVFLIMDNAHVLAQACRVPLVGVQLRAFRPAAALLHWDHVVDFLIEGHEAMTRAWPVDWPLQELERREAERIERLLGDGALN